jgi:hypothetical protein
VRTSDTASTPFVVVLNWFAELDRLATIH